MPTVHDHAADLADSLERLAAKARRVQRDLHAELPTTEQRRVILDAFGAASLIHDALDRLTSP